MSIDGQFFSLRKLMSEIEGIHFNSQLGAHLPNDKSAMELLFSLTKYLSVART